MDTLIPNPIGFQWDDGNKDKNWIKHKVKAKEAEEVFFNKPRIMAKDEKHSTHTELRFGVYGKTNQQRLLFVVFTIRNNTIRIISAREQNKKEKATYEKKAKANTKL